jgi:hypothetical protein
MSPRLRQQSRFRVSIQWIAHALTFLTVFGPGLIVMEADNDAGAVSTYVQSRPERNMGRAPCGFFCCFYRSRILFRRWWCTLQLGGIYGRSLRNASFLLMINAAECCNWPV